MNCGPNHRVKFPKVIFIQFQFSEIMWNFDRERWKSDQVRQIMEIMITDSAWQYLSHMNSGKTDTLPKFNSWLY